MLPDFIRTFISSEYSQLKSELPNALDFGIDYVEYVLERSPDEATLRFGIAVSMLDRDRSNENFEFGILERHYNDPKYLWQDNRALEMNASRELQGYVGTTLLVLATYVAFNQLRGAQYNRNIHEHLIYASLQRSSQFQKLPTQVRDASWQFVRGNLAYVIDAYRSMGLDNVASMLDIIVERAESENSNEFYVRGVRTAGDTYILYLELISRVRSKL